MKPVRRLMLSGDRVPLTDISLVLELNACGRGFITAQTTTDYTGKLVRLDAGYPQLLLRWFTGYVERSQPAENGAQRLFVRELTGIFERLWPVSLQHPTLRQLAAWLTEHSGLTFQLAAGADYNDKPVPHFIHSGSGYQLLAAIGAVFGIADYVWYQLPDGAVYTGSWQHSLFAGKPVSIPAQFSQSVAAGNTLSIPLIPSVRPGAEVNGRRLTRVHLNNDNMLLTWMPCNNITGRPSLPGRAEARSAGAPHPVLARVESPCETLASGDMADPFRPRYAVNLQLLDDDGRAAADTPVWCAVPLPLPMAGTESGLFQFPPPGTLVEVAFTGGRPDKPFVRQILSGGNTLPALQPGEQLQQQREGVSQRVTVAGDWERNTDQAIRETSMNRVITADDETRTLVARETTVQATDTTRVLGTATLLAGAIAQLSAGDYSLATRASYTASAGKNITTDVGQDLTEKIGNIRSSIAAARQEVIAPVVWIGSQQINLMTLMLDTLTLVNELAQLTAAHTHAGTPLNAADIAATGSGAGRLREKYSPVIG